ncbi:MAG: sugar phosphate isomerase/epimerase [Planctomycetaceae bacterium]|nr:sugar phosphate isomerase/epimerase [Planctomycetaceae bacterium]
MKYAICQELYEGWEWEKQCAFTAETGYTGIEIAPFTIASRAEEITAEQRKQIGSVAQAAGLDVVGLHWLLAKTEGFHLTTNDLEVQKKTALYFGELARLCRDLGGSVMVLGSPPQRNLLPGITHEQAMKNAAAVIEQALPFFEENDVVLALEPLARTETDFMLTCESASNVIADFNSPHIRLHQDVKAMSDESISIPELITKYKDVIAHFHANDLNLRGPGMGDVDFLPIFQALKDTNYQGWVSVEVFDYTPGAEKIAIDSIEYMKRIWEQVK